MLIKRGDRGEQVRILQRMLSLLPDGVFGRLTASLVMRYKGIRWWCGRNLADWSRDYPFDDDPTCAERYASVCERWLGWWPWLWAYRNNRVARVEPCDADVLLLDYVDID